MSRPGAVLLLLTLAGCASHTGVVSIGGGNYMIARQAATGFSGLGNLKAEIIAEGSKRCESDGKDFKLISSEETKPPYIFGNFPRSEITFTCVARANT